MKEITIGAAIHTPGSSLRNKTGGWRTFRPIINYEECIRCMTCWNFCPDAAIRKVEDEHPKFKQKPVIDYDYCKGCGICAYECPKKCIEMVKEEK